MHLLQLYIFTTKIFLCVDHADDQASSLERSADIMADRVSSDTELSHLIKSPPLFTCGMLSALCCNLQSFEVMEEL